MPFEIGTREWEFLYCLCVVLLKCSFFLYSVFRDVKTSRDTTQLGRGRGRGERGKSDRGGRGRGAGRGNSLVQSSGLFSEGTGETHMRRSSGELACHIEDKEITVFTVSNCSIQPDVRRWRWCSCTSSTNNCKARDKD